MKRKQTKGEKQWTATMAAEDSVVRVETRKKESESGKGAERQDRQTLPLAVGQREAASALNVSLSHFERHIKADLPVVLSGSKRLYRVEDLNAWLARALVNGGRGVA